MKTLVLPDDHDLCIRTFLGEIESLKPGPRKGALHVGAHVGEEVPAYAAAGYRPIYLVEANPELLPVLNGRFDHDPNVHVIATAIGDTAGSVEFIVHRTRKGSVESASILPLERLGEIVPVFDSSARYTVPVCTIDGLIGSQGIAGRLDLLVLDIQGAELHALRGATEALKAFSFVICEVNLINNYAGGALERDVDAFLEGAGFTKRLAIYHELYDASGRFPAWGECLWHR